VISLDMSLRHMAWADAKLFSVLQELPKPALKSSYASPEWSVAHIAMHILQGAEWYCYILIGSKWTELREPESAADVAEMSAYLQRMYETLIEQSTLPDEMVDFEDEDGVNSKPRSMVLAQAIYHSIEHRTQIAIALETNGNRAIDLDTYDLWHFLAQLES
jgi:uncharacterized damage-inducible protein DinB